MTTGGVGSVSSGVADPAAGQLLMNGLDPNAEVPHGVPSPVGPSKPVTPVHR
jgi:hypothetical protein